MAKGEGNIGLESIAPADDLILDAFFDGMYNTYYIHKVKKSDGMYTTYYIHKVNKK